MVSDMEAWQCMVLGSGHFPGSTLNPDGGVRAMLMFVNLHCSFQGGRCPVESGSARPSCRALLCAGCAEAAALCCAHGLLARPPALSVRSHEPGCSRLSVQLWSVWLRPQSWMAVERPGGSPGGIGFMLRSWQKKQVTMCVAERWFHFSLFSSVWLEILMQLDLKLWQPLVLAKDGVIHERLQGYGSETWSSSLPAVRGMCVGRGGLSFCMGFFALRVEAAGIRWTMAVAQSGCSCCPQYLSGPIDMCLVAWVKKSRSEGKRALVLRRSPGAWGEEKQCKAWAPYSLGSRLPMPAYECGCLLGSVCCRWWTETSPCTESAMLQYCRACSHHLCVALKPCSGMEGKMLRVCKLANSSLHRIVPCTSGRPAVCELQGSACVRLLNHCRCLGRGCWAQRRAEMAGVEPELQEKTRSWLTSPFLYYVSVAPVELCIPSALPHWERHQ